jgi:hypothetical protein
MYSHTQFGWTIITVLVAALIIISAAGSRLGPGSPGWGALMAAEVLLALLVPVFGWLTVTVDREAVTAKFGIGIIRRKIRLMDIESAARVRNKWYYGWGIHRGPGGWIFNVSGLDAVQIVLKRGGKFRIGSDEPEELTRAIRERIEIGVELTADSRR